MSNTLLIISIFLMPLILFSAFGNHNGIAVSSGNGTNTGGLSANSVDVANSNNTASVIDNPGNGTNTGGLSANSVDVANSNNTASVIDNPGNGTNTGGLSANSVDKAISNY